MHNKTPYETGSQTVLDAAVADDNGVIIGCEGLATVCVQLTGTLAASDVYFEGTVDDETVTSPTWVGVLGWNRNTGVKDLVATAVGLYAIDVTGLSQFRVRLDWTTADEVTAVAKGTSLPITTLVTA